MTATATATQIATARALFVSHYGTDTVDGFVQALAAQTPSAANIVIEALAAQR